MSGPLAGLVLVGGRSTRMGREKWALPYGGVPQVSRAAALLTPHTREVRLSCRPEQVPSLRPLGMPLVVDREPGRGPMMGIASALAVAPETAWLVVACDLPLLDEETLRALVGGRNPRRPVTACTGPSGEPEPLCAIYEPGAAPLLEAALAAGENSPLRLLRAAGAALVTAPDPRALLNVNHPGEYGRVLRRLERGKED